MKKIVSLFQRNYEGDRQVRNEIVPGAEWVAAGEGVATRKMDGTCCAVIDGKLYKRYDAKKGKEPPAGFIPAQEPDEKTGHWPGWLLVDPSNPGDKWHVEAWNRWVISGHPIQEGTYELVGPKIQGNPERREVHGLVYHGGVGLVLEPQPPRDFEGISVYLTGRDIEGIVWHHPDGRMVKIKAKDFGLKRAAVPA
jgi:hypothetical protein